MACAEEPGPGDGLRARHDLCRRPLGDDLPAVSPGPRTHVDEMVGRENGLAIVLDDEDCVAEIAQPHLRGDEAGVVAGVKAHAWLVEHVEHAHERRADLRSQTNPLALARRQRLRAAVEGEVVEADVDEKAEARGDRLQERFGDRALARSEDGRVVGAGTGLVGQALHEGTDVTEGHCPHLGHVFRP